MFVASWCCAYFCVVLWANYAPLVADLFLFCYKSEFMKNLCKSNDLNLIEKFNKTYIVYNILCLNISSIYIIIYNTFVSAVWRS